MELEIKLDNRQGVTKLTLFPRHAVGIQSSEPVYGLAFPDPIRMDLSEERRKHVIGLRPGSLRWQVKYRSPVNDLVAMFACSFDHNLVARRVAAKGITAWTPHFAASANNTGIYSGCSGSMLSNRHSATCSTSSVRQSNIMLLHGSVHLVVGYVSA